MRFAFSRQQTEFRDAVRHVLDKECTTSDLRAAFAAPAARTRRWSVLADMGVVGIAVPTACGGLGLDVLDLVLLLEEAGRAGLPEPLLETAALAAPLLDAYAMGVGARSPGDQWTQLLASIADGAVAAAVAPMSVNPRLEPASSGVAPPGPTSSGTVVVPGADGADLFILATTAAGAGPEIHAVPAESVVVTPVPSLDPTRRLGTVEWEPSAATRVASGETAHRAIADLSDRAAVATAAELIGLADRMITLAADYAKERHQFGRAIGSFQAVKHLLAGAQVKLEFARPVTYGAAWSVAEGEPTASRSASVAKAYASDAATEAARVSLQIHGAIGYTWECDLQLFVKRAWALAASWGSAADHRHRVLTSLMDTDHLTT